MILVFSLRISIISGLGKTQTAKGDNSEFKDTKDTHVITRV